MPRKSNRPGAPAALRRRAGQVVNDQALTSLFAPGDSAVRRADLAGRSAIFFTEANIPLEQTHAAALALDANLHALTHTLDQRTHDLADSHRELRQEISQRQTAESLLASREQSYGELLADSQRLEAQVREMAAKIISATEQERKKMSLHLNDETAQSLLGINIRMAALKQMIAAHDADFTRELTAIQSLIEGAADIITRLANEFTFQHAR